MRFLAVLALSLLVFTLPSHAAPPACNAGAEGTIVYNKDAKLVQFCNGTDWIGMVAKIGGTGDTLGDLSCSNDEVPTWDGSAWVCGAGGSGLWADSGNGYLTYTGTDVGIKIQSVTGMAAPTNTLVDLGCANDEILKWDGDSWECAADDAGALADNAVTNAKMADDAIGLAELSATGTASASTYLRGDNTWATPTFSLPTLTSANIWVGNGSNAATAVAMSGDATLSNAGVLTIGSNAVGSAEITNASLALADLSATGTASGTTYLRGDNTWATPTFSLPTLTSANIWVGNGSNAATAVTMSGDATLSSAGVLTIGSNAISSPEITDGTVELADLSATGTASATTYLRGDNTWATPSAGGGLGGAQRFTASGTFVVPAGVTMVKVSLTGGGGSGGRCDTGDYGGAGGAGGTGIGWLAGLQGCECFGDLSQQAFVNVNTP